MSIFPLAIALFFCRCYCFSWDLKNVKVYHKLEILREYTSIHSNLRQEIYAVVICGGMMQYAHILEPIAMLFIGIMQLLSYCFSSFWRNHRQLLYCRFLLEYIRSISLSHVSKSIFNDQLNIFARFLSNHWSTFTFHLIKRYSNRNTRLRQTGWPVPK